MPTRANPTIAWHATTALSAALLWTLSIAPARADDKARMPALVPQAYTQECGSCHLAYPPGLLPARSWQRLMTGLDSHFGSDASLDAAAMQPLSQWLQTHAATSRKLRAEPPHDRITQADWFVRKHRRVDRSVWAHPSVKSAANCAACHPGAERGDFDDDDLRTPPGIDPSLARRWRD